MQEIECLPAGGCVNAGEPSPGKLMDRIDSSLLSKADASARRNTILLSTTLKHDIKPSSTFKME
jgi:hypothetical protein